MPLGAGTYLLADIFLLHDRRFFLFGGIWMQDFIAVI